MADPRPRPPPIDVEDCSKVALNPDISGTGVLIGFITTAYFTLFILCVYYVAGYFPDESRNSVDNSVLGLSWRKRFLKSKRTWKPTLESAVLMMSDQQLVTGIALLASGYAQLPNGISSYDWQLVVYLAWFSSVTHLATLTVLRQYFHKNHAARLWRTILMLLMIVMLGIALLPTGDGWWLGELDLDPSNHQLAGLPALCYFKWLVSQAPDRRFMFTLERTPSMFTSLMMLFLSYLTRLIKLSGRSSAFVGIWVRHKPGRLLKSIIKVSICRAGGSRANRFWRLNHLAFETLYICLRATYDIIESGLWEILWLSFALIWGTLQLFHTRRDREPEDLNDTEKNAWAFGQILPVVLLALPILSLGQKFYEIKEINQSEFQTPARDVQSTVTVGETLDKEPICVFRVGQWRNARTSTLPITQTTTNITHRYEEAKPRAIESVTHPNDHIQADNDAPRGVQPQETFPAGTSVVSKDQESGFSCHYYDFEWFRILIGMIILLAVHFGLWIPFSFNSMSVVNVFLETQYLIAIVLMLFSVPLYAGVFVILAEYHDSVERIIHHNLGLRPYWQRKCLRFGAYAYPCSVFAVSLGQFVIIFFYIIRHMGD